MKKPLGVIVDAFIEKYGQSRIEDDEELQSLQRNLEKKLETYPKEWNYEPQNDSLLLLQKFLPELFPVE